MKGVKKIIALVLSLAMIFTLDVTGIFAENVNAATTFMLTSPTEGSLKAAGYIDIEWSEASTTETVASYKVYVDGKNIKTTTDRSCEYYTTAVTYHTVYVVANFTNGTTASTPAIKFGVTKKGICVNTKDMGVALDPASINAGWYYNWDYRSFKDTGFRNKKFNSIEYVPMVWNADVDYDVTRKIDFALSKEYKYILGFNEPDLPKQANMSVDKVLSLWPNFMNKGLRVGSPSSALWPASSKKWFQPFMNKINADPELDVDFITIHCYPDNWNGGKSMADWFLREVVDKTWEMYHKPIWITEFSTSGNGITEQGTKSFLENVMPGLDSRSYVERYSFFSFDRSTFAGGLWYFSTGVLSEAGKTYAKYGNPMEKSPETDLDKDAGRKPVTSITVKKPAKAAIKSAKNIKKRKIKLTLKKIKRIKGYQIRWSDNKKYRGYWQKNIKKRTYIIKKLDKKTKYYIKVRAYVLNGKKKVYGRWSKTKRVLVKK